MSSGLKGREPYPADGSPAIGHRRVPDTTGLGLVQGKLRLAAAPRHR